jgi:hypothetical protein
MALPPTDHTSLSKGTEVRSVVASWQGVAVVPEDATCPSGRSLICRRVLEQGWTLREAPEAAGFSRPIAASAIQASSSMSGINRLGRRPTYSARG